MIFNGVPVGASATDASKPKQTEVFGGSIRLLLPPSGGRLTGRVEQDTGAPLNGGIDSSLGRPGSVKLDDSLFKWPLLKSFPPTPSPGSDSGQGTQTTQHQDFALRRQTIIVRLTNHGVDEGNSSRALHFASLMLSHGNVTVILLLDKDAARLANRNILSYAAATGANRAHSTTELIEEFISAGGAVIASISWAHSYGIDASVCIQNVRLLSDKEVIEEILNCDKILDY